MLLQKNITYINQEFNAPEAELDNVKFAHLLLSYLLLLLLTHTHLVLDKI